MHTHLQSKPFFKHHVRYKICTTMQTGSVFLCRVKAGFMLRCSSKHVLIKQLDLAEHMSTDTHAVIKRLLIIRGYDVVHEMRKPDGASCLGYDQFSVQNVQQEAV